MKNNGRVVGKIWAWWERFVTHYGPEIVMYNGDGDGEIHCRVAVFRIKPKLPSFIKGGIIPANNRVLFPDTVNDMPETIIPLESLEQLLKAFEIPCELYQASQTKNLAVYRQPLYTMSWSVNYVGLPANVVAALQKESERLTGDSKAEFDRALPGLIMLVESNYNTQYPAAIKLSANGHAYKSNDQSYGTCNIVLENAGATVV